MKTVLICHKGSFLNHPGLSMWLNSFSNLSGVIIIDEPKNFFLKRIKYEYNRVGLLRLIDVIAFRIFYKFFLKKKDIVFEKYLIKILKKKYTAIRENIPILKTESPNSNECYNFLKKTKPNFVIARCKVIIKEKIFSIPSHGTFIMHPGICPDYRNSHGCFWAIANEDYDNIGMTFLKVDKGIDTGPIFAYFKVHIDKTKPLLSHNIIQIKSVFDNLDGLKIKLKEIYNNQISPIKVSNRNSKLWGQPWLTEFIKIKLRSIKNA